MVNVNRRDLCVALSSFVALTVAGEGQAGKGPMPGETAVAPPKPAADRALSQSQAFRFDDLPVTKNANGESRPVTRGVLSTGEAVEVHETTLLPGHMPHPPHKHRHSEFLMIREGQVEFEMDGKSERVGPGSVLFSASEVMHGLKNVGDVPANYFVIAIGRQGA